MDVFRLRSRLINDFGDYVRSFIHIADPRVREVVDEALEQGLLWPDPLIQLNPSFEPGGWIDELIGDDPQTSFGKIRGLLDEIHTARPDLETDMRYKRLNEIAIRRNL